MTLKQASLSDSDLKILFDALSDTLIQSELTRDDCVTLSFLLLPCGFTFPASVKRMRCTNCKRAHTACDGSIPCERCVRLYRTFSCVRGTPRILRLRNKRFNVKDKKLRRPGSKRFKFRDGERLSVSYCREVEAAVEKARRLIQLDRKREDLRKLLLSYRADAAGLLLKNFESNYIPLSPLFQVDESIQTNVDGTRFVRDDLLEDLQLWPRSPNDSMVGDW